MAPTDLRQTVDQLIHEVPETLLLLEKLQLEYYQVKDQSLEDLCGEQGLDRETLAHLLTTFRDDQRHLDEEVLKTYDIPQLIGHILFNHHLFMERELPRLERLLEQALREDGSAHSELLELQMDFQKFKAFFLFHMREEEKRFFPFFLFVANDRSAPTMGEEGLEDFIRVIQWQDDALEGDLERLKQRTRWYHVPADAGPGYRSLLSGLILLEIDMRRHMRVENGILFPKIIALQMDSAQRQRAPRIPG